MEFSAYTHPHAGTVNLMVCFEKTVKNTFFFSRITSEQILFAEINNFFFFFKTINFLDKQKSLLIAAYRCLSHRETATQTGVKSRSFWRNARS